MDIISVYNQEFIFINMQHLIDKKIISNEINKSSFESSLSLQNNLSFIL